MIRREDVADLREGDVVELGFSAGSVVRGPLVEDRHIGGLGIAEVGWAVRLRDGGLSYGLERDVETLTIISRAPRPTYVNSDKTEPDPGDVVRDADGDDRRAWVRAVNDFGSPWYVLSHVMTAESRDELPDRLRLLVDGTTGQVVP